MNNNLLKKFIEFGIGNILVLILGFISSPIITRLISPDQMGKFSMFNTVCNLILICITLGLDQAYVRFFYEEKEYSRYSLLKKSISIPLRIIAILSIFIILLYRPISRFIVGEVSISVIIIMSLFIFFSLIGRFSLLVIRMKQKGKLYSVLQVLGKISYILCILTFFVIFRDNYITMMLSITVSNIIIVVISIYMEKEEWNFKNDINLESEITQKDLLSYGTPLIFSMAIVWIFQSIDKVTLNIFSGYNELGLYTAAFSIVGLLNALKNTFTTFWVPVANEKYVNNPHEIDFFIKMNKIVSLFMMVLGILLIGFKDIIILLLGAKYKEAVFIFPFLVFTPIMYTISETTVIGIGFKKKNKYHIYIAIISALINLIGNLILVPSLGAKGAAISTGIAYIVFFLARTYFSNKVYKVNYSLKRLYISIILLSILSLYSTMNTLDKNIIIMTGVFLLTIFWLYRDTLNEVIYKFKKILKANCN